MNLNTTDILLLLDLLDEKLMSPRITLYQIRQLEDLEARLVDILEQTEPLAKSE